MWRVIRKIVARMPRTWQRELRRMHLLQQIRNGKFLSPEPEFALLDQFVKDSDTAIDVGANVGHYTGRLSQLVGPAGRVFAFEPVAETFAILTWNMQYLGARNVTLVNAALSDGWNLVEMAVPSFNDGIPNYYRAQITGMNHPGAERALAIKLDGFYFGPRVALIKIDVEGHERAVLNGMREIIERDHPVIIIETGSGVVQDSLKDAGYIVERLKGSPNLLCIYSVANSTH